MTRPDRSREHATRPMASGVDDVGTATRRGSVERPEAADAPALSIRQGPRAGVVFVVPMGTTRLGRDRACDVVLDDPTVSGQHAELARSDGRVLLRDAGSLNGTYLNGHLCQQAALVEGDEVWIGRFHFTFEDRPRSRRPPVGAGDA